MDWLLQVDDYAEWIEGFGIWAIIISLSLNIVISILGIVPSLFLSGANAVVFGLIPGFLISLAGELLGACISFWLYRWGFGKMRNIRHETWQWLQQLNHASRNRRMLLLFIARLTPFLPSGVITFAASVSQMSFVDFLVVTLFGKIPSIATETLLGHDLYLIQENFPRLLITLMLLVVMFLLLKKKRNT